MPDSSAPISIVLVTGPSGAGRTTAVNALEDLGYETIDNIPFRLVPALLEGALAGPPIALGLDVRNRDFSAAALIELIDSLTRDARVQIQVLYVDCAPDELVSRFSQTRRRHPLAPQDTPQEGVAREIDLLAPIRARADHLIDTTDLSPHDLKREIGLWFGKAADNQILAVSLHSFSYRRGIPRGLDMVIDCRFLRNPHWVPGLRPLDGQMPAVATYVEGDERFAEFFQKLCDMIIFLLPAYHQEGKSYLAVGFGCSGGRHRSVAVAEKTAIVLAQNGWQASCRHRELERHQPAPRRER